jgi:hypothetical protein
MRRVHPGQIYGEDRDEAAVLTVPKKPRSKVACEACRRRKLRCTGESPCRQCQASNEPCTFSRGNRTTSTSSRHDDGSQTFGQPISEAPNREMEISVDDTMAPDPAAIPQRATLSNESQWSTTNARVLTTDRAQISNPGNIRQWDQGQEDVTSQLNQFQPLADWSNDQDDLRLAEAESFQGADYGLANIGQGDSLWDWDSFVSRTWQIMEALLI